MNRPANARGPAASVRVPPHSTEAEMAVLGAMMLDGVERGVVERAASLLGRDDFYRDVHAHLFDAMIALAERGTPVEVVTLKAALESRGILEQVGGLDYLLKLADLEYTIENVTHYAAIVRDRARKRRLIAECAAIASDAYSGNQSATVLQENAERRLFALRPQDASTTLHRLRDLTEAELKAIDQRGQNDSRIAGIATGFLELDWYLGGMKPAEFLLLAARPSVGKSALATAIAANVLKAGYSVLFFSLEMSGQQIAQRMLTAEGGVNSQAVRTGRLEGYEWQRLLSGNNRLWEGHCFIDDGTGLTPASLRAACRRVKAQHGLDLVILDYLQLMNGQGTDGRQGENRNAELSVISRSLKLAAKEFGVPLLALSQLSRNVERRDNKRPMLSDLRDSGSLEQDADVVMFLHREDYQAEGGTAATNSVSPVDTEVIIRKQRMGPTGTATLGFIPAYARFVNLAWNTSGKF